MTALSLPRKQFPWFMIFILGIVLLIVTALLMANTKGLPESSTNFSPAGGTKIIEIGKHRAMGLEWGPDLKNCHWRVNQYFDWGAPLGGWKLHTEGYWKQFPAPCTAQELANALEKWFQELEQNSIFSPETLQGAKDLITWVKNFVPPIPN